MFKLKELLERDRKELSAIITAEHGKVLSDCRRRSAARAGGGGVRLRHTASAEGRVHRSCRPPALMHGRFRQPLGVVAGITPFNFPADGAAVDDPGGAGLRQTASS